MEICKCTQSVCFSNVSCARLKGQQQHFCHFDAFATKRSLKEYVDAAGGPRCRAGRELHGGKAQVLS